MALKVLNDGKTFAEVNSDNPTICFLHGWGRSSNDFNLISSKFDSISIDLPGFGKSQEPENSMNPKEYADYLTHLIPDRVNVLVGHSFGNLFLVAMSGVTGSVEGAIHETSRVLAVRGRILPATLEDIHLVGQTQDGSTIHGESAITAAATTIKSVGLDPNHPEAYPDAVNAIRNAELIVMGPGSLYTSILPNILVPDIRISFLESNAMKIYVSNVATQHGETDHYTCLLYTSDAADE